ncbi:hypothetical protein LCGC14_1993350, partial [marine sediment metagenome]
IESHTFICSYVTIGNRVFLGHGVMLCNDRWPRIISANHPLEKIVIEDDATIGSGATILPGVNIGENAVVGAGAVVTKSVPHRAVVAGNPARILRYRDD